MSAGKIDALGSIAVHLAPAFRDKFDFSDPKDYDLLAERAWLAAEALVRKKDAMLLAYEQAEAKAVAEKEAKK